MNILFAIASFLSLSFYSNIIPSENTLLINSEIKCVYNYPYSTNDRLYLIEITLTNNSDSDISFLTHSCTTDENVVTDPNNVIVIGKNCASNSNTTVTLKSKQVFRLVTILKCVTYVPNYLRIGWVLLNHENTQSAFDYLPMLQKSKEKLENIIWAPIIELNCCIAHPYEIK